MKNVATTALIIFLFSTLAMSQKFTQTIRGTIIDIDSQLPIIGAIVKISGSDPLVGTATDVDGKFKLEHIPIGRITLELSFLGYKNTTIPNIVVNSGKEVILDLSMQESVMKMNEVVISAYKNKGEAINEMSIISTRSISAEETKRYAGGFDDPSRILANFAGVNSTQNGSNEIIVRGNSPKYIQWRMEGVEISNPNHFADQNAVGGAVNALNNNLLATSDFSTGAFSPEYGGALSGVYDVKLRTGNNEKFESTFGLGLLGTDLTLEGPFKKGKAGSYLVNYRYSTISLIDKLGLVDMGGIPKFQDMTFKVVLPTKKMGTFSVFALGGLSGLLLKDLTPAVWETPGDNSMKSELTQQLEKKSHLLNSGINHSISLNDHSYVKTSLSYSNEGIADDIFESEIIQTNDGQGVFSRDTLEKVLNDKVRLNKSTYRQSITYNNKINSKNKIQVGATHTLFEYSSKQSKLQNNSKVRTTLVDFKENIGVLNNFISWKYSLSDDITIVSGLHNTVVLFNKKSTLEPRLAVNWELNNKSSLNVGYGKHSTMESVHNYFTKVTQQDGTITEPNKDLDLLKAHHYVLGYENRFTNNLRAKIEVYYQDLYNLPVENNDSSYYSTINEGLAFKYVDLVNKGTGKNYGIELTLERFFHKNYYYLINASVYNSKYTALDGIERNTQYNGNYLINVLGGKEFDKLGKKQNQTLALNAKVFYGGGKKIIPLLRDEQGNLAVDPAKGEYWDYTKAYKNKIEDTYQVTLSASYKFNKPKATHEIFVNIDNVTNNKGKISEYYDESKPKSIGYVTQFGFFPNLMYKVSF